MTVFVLRVRFALLDHSLRVIVFFQTLLSVAPHLPQARTQHVVMQRFVLTTLNLHSVKSLPVEPHTMNIPSAREREKERERERADVVYLCRSLSRKHVCFKCDFVTKCCRVAVDGRMLCS